MFELKRIVLWFLVLVAPGGLLLLPAVLIDAAKHGLKKAPSDEAHGHVP